MSYYLVVEFTNGTADRYGPYKNRRDVEDLCTDFEPETCVANTYVEGGEDEQ